MPVDWVFPLAALAAALLIARVASGRAVDPDPDDAARRFVDTQIDAHIERLTRDYRETVPGGAADDVPPAFAKRIETFIGNVILWDALTALHDDDTADAVRELVVTERQSIYDRVLSGVRTRLATDG